jgi:hypothetical protein
LLICLIVDLWNADDADFGGLRGFFLCVSASLRLNCSSLLICLVV